MASSDNSKDLQARLAKAKQGIEQSLARQAELEKFNSILTWGVVVVVCLFMFAGYHKVKSNFAAEKIQQSLVTQGPEMMTEILDAVVETASEVVPVYYEQAQAKSVEVMPEIAQVLDKEMVEFGDSATNKVLAQLEDAIKKVEAEQKTKLKQAFPDLTDEQVDKIITEVFASLEEQLSGTTGYILSKTVGDIANFDKTLKSFNTKDLPNDEIELSRLMMHNVLLLLDEELMTMKFESAPADGNPAKGGK